MVRRSASNGVGDALRPGGVGEVLKAGELFGAKGDGLGHGAFIAEEAAGPAKRLRSPGHVLNERRRTGPVARALDEVIFDGIGDGVDELVEAVGGFDQPDGAGGLGGPDSPSGPGGN